MTASETPRAAGAENETTRRAFGGLAALLMRASMLAQRRGFRLTARALSEGAYGLVYGSDAVRATWLGRLGFEGTLAAARDGKSL